PHFLLFTVLAFFIGFASVVLEKNMPTNNFENYNNLYLVICGFFMSFGIIIPGVSSTIILMLLNIYHTYILAVSSLYYPVLIPLGFGLILGCLICMKLTKYLFKNFYPQTFYTIIGFTLGSVLVLMPDFSSLLHIFIFATCSLFGFIIINFITTNKA
ncbi:MAG: DUF368 domain-containing protein, partial [Clostridia bacterium]|nr:DUF368 domain-containing protein [Clostridia bacterium]